MSLFFAFTEFFFQYENSTSELPSKFRVFEPKNFGPENFGYFQFEFQNLNAKDFNIPKNVKFRL